MIKAIAYLQASLGTSFQSCKGQSSSPAPTSAGFADSIHSRYFDSIPNAHLHSLCPKDTCKDWEMLNHIYNFWTFSETEEDTTICIFPVVSVMSILEANKTGNF